MQDKKRKNPLSRLGIVCLVILIPIVYWRTTLLLFQPMNLYTPLWFSPQLGLLVIVGFDIMWVILMKLCPLKCTKVKIVLTVLVLTLSASVITCWILLISLSDMW